MVICAYPGIGTTTLCNTNLKYLELQKQMMTDKSGFYIGSTPKSWISPYVSTAYNLHLQGYMVFISSNIDVVVEAASRFPNDIVIIHPAEELQDVWVDRLYKKYVSIPSNPRRYEHPNGAKMIAYANWQRTRQELTTIISAYEKLQVYRVQITKPDYDLAYMVQKLESLI